MILCVGWDNRQCDGTPQSSHWKTYKGGPRAAATISIFKSYSVFLPNWHSFLSFPVIWPLSLFRQTSKLIAPVHLGLRLVVDSPLHVHCFGFSKWVIQMLGPVSFHCYAYSPSCCYSYWFFFYRRKHGGIWLLRPFIIVQLVEAIECKIWWAK